MTDTHIVWKHHLVPFPPSTSSTETLPPFSRSRTLCLSPITSSETERRPSLLHRTLPNLLTAHAGMHAKYTSTGTHTSHTHAVHQLAQSANVKPEHSVHDPLAIYTTKCTSGAIGV